MRERVHSGECVSGTIFDNDPHFVLAPRHLMNWLPPVACLPPGQAFAGIRLIATGSLLSSEVPSVQGASVSPEGANLPGPLSAPRRRRCF